MFYNIAPIWSANATVHCRRVISSTLLKAGYTTHTRVPKILHVTQEVTYSSGHNVSFALLSSKMAVTTVQKQLRGKREKKTETDCMTEQQIDTKQSNGENWKRNLRHCVLFCFVLQWNVWFIAYNYKPVTRVKEMWRPLTSALFAVCLGHTHG